VRLSPGVCRRKLRRDQGRQAGGKEPRCFVASAPGLPREVVLGENKNCGNCSYSLKDLGSNQCPECGSFNREAKTAEKDRRAAKQDLKWFYLQPLIGIAVGLGLSVVLSQALGGSLVFIFIGFAVSLVVSFLAFFAASMAFIGFDEPISVSSLRMGAVVAISQAINMGINSLPSGSSASS
jgi:hypothetical protein